jgi:hypothetical protein
MILELGNTSLMWCGETKRSSPRIAYCSLVELTEHSFLRSRFLAVAYAAVSKLEADSPFPKSRFELNDGADGAF